MRVRLKVCCIQDETEARLAVGAGADALGLVSAMPSGPGPISEDEIAAVAAAVPFGVSSVLLTAATGAEEIAAQQRRCGTNAIQLVQTPEPGALEALRLALPGVALIQVVHVEGPASVDGAIAAAPLVDALLLDSGRPAQGELGGTGRTHDWSLSRAVVEGAAAPVYLAGGLTPENVAEAVAQVRPFGVDVCSGLRPAGRLDSRRLEAFVAALASAE